MDASIDKWCIKSKERIGSVGQTPVAVNKLLTSFSNPFGKGCTINIRLNGFLWNHAQLTGWENLPLYRKRNILVTPRFS